MVTNNCGISVIIPVFNAEKYIEICLESVIKQVYNDLEIICVIDKNSKDNSEKIVKNIAAKDNRIQVLTPLGGSGAGYNRNIGIEKAKREYIGFVDADDYIDSNFYEILYEHAKKNNADVAMGETIIINNENNEIYKEHRYRLQTADSLIEIFSLINEGVCWDKIYKTSLLKNDMSIRFPENTFHEDNLFVLKVMNNCNKLVTAPDALYYWIRNQDSICFNEDYAEKRIQDANLVLNLVFDYLILNKKTKKENLQIINFMINKFGWMAVQDKRFKNSLAQKIFKYTM